MLILVGNLQLDLPENVCSDASCRNHLSEISSFVLNNSNLTFNSNFGLDGVCSGAMVSTPNGEVEIQNLNVGDQVKTVDNRFVNVVSVNHFSVNPSSVQKPILLTSSVSRPTIVSIGAKVFTSRIIPVKYCTHSRVNHVGNVHYVNLTLEGGSTYFMVNGIGIRSN